VRHFGLFATASGGVARLRELILTMAVQGNLVQQEPKDEPASNVLERIRSKRDQLVAQGYIKRVKSEGSSEVRDPPFGAPSGWEWVCAGDVCSVITDGDHQAPPKADSGVPFLVIGDVRDGSVGLDTATRFVPQEYFDGLDWAKKPLLGDVLYTTVGSLGIPVPIVRQESFCFQRHIALFRPGLTELQGFLTLALQSRLAFDQAERGATGIAQKTVPLSLLRKLQLPLPPLAEQLRIVSRVDELMKLCDALEQSGRLADEEHSQLTSTLFDALAASESAHVLAENWQRVAEHFDLLLDRPEALAGLEQTILHLAVRGQLAPQIGNEESAQVLLERIALLKSPARGKSGATVVPREDLSAAAPFELPDSWAWASFGDVARIASNLVQPALHASAWQIAPDCIEKGTGKLLARRTVRESEVTSANHSFSAGQILYSKIRPSLSKAVIVDFAGLCSADMYPIEARIDSRFLLLVMLSQVFLDQVKEAENRVKMPKLNQEALNRFLVPVPPVAEQRRIVARVEELRKLSAGLHECLKQARETQSRLADALVAEVT
jgi:type I restriction enzyme S subunit